jgi:hypothetical protein
VRTFWKEALFGGPWLGSWMTLLWALFWVGLRTTPGADFDQVGAFGLLLAAVVACWLVEVIRYWIRHRGERRTPRPAPIGRYLVLPGLSALVILAALSDLPLRARFELSRSAFDDYVRTQQARTETSGVKLGSYRVREIRPTRHGLFFVTGSGIFENYGFVHAPDAADTEQFDCDLGGGWWTMSKSVDLFGSSR